MLLGFTNSQACGSCSKNSYQSTVSAVAKNETKTVQLKITGMTCAGCSNHVTKALGEVKGVSSVDLVYPGDVATIKYDSKTTNKGALIKAIEKINYKAEEIELEVKKTSSQKKKSCVPGCGH